LESNELLLALIGNGSCSKNIGSVLRADVVVEEIVVEVDYDSALKLDLINVWVKEQVREFRGPRRCELDVQL
jgi:hypothetical protein